MFERMDESYHSLLPRNEKKGSGALSSNVSMPFASKINTADLVEVDLHSSASAASENPGSSSILKMISKKTAQLFQLPKLIKQHIASKSKSTTSLSSDSIAMTSIPAQNSFKSKENLLETHDWKKDQEAIAEHRFILHPIFASRYRLLASIGEGSFGFVWRAERIADSQGVAVKFIRRSKIPESAWFYDPSSQLRIPSEVHFLQRLNHPNIVRFLDFFDDRDYIYLVTELHGTSWTLPNARLSSESHPQLKAAGHFRTKPRAAGKEPPCDLFECIEAHSYLPASLILHIFRQVLSAVLYMHRQGILHRDIKDENIVIDEHYNIWIIDFGSASLIPLADGGYFSRFNGTVSFAAPEVGYGSGRYNGLKAESWTLGVLLYTMAFKRAPFVSGQAARLETLVIPTNSPNSRELAMIDLIRKLLEKDPSKRLAAASIQQHPWLK